MTLGTTIGGVRFEVDTVAELEALAAGAPAIFKVVKEIEQAAIAVGVLTKTNTGNPASTVSEGPPAKGTPRCDHGAMKDLGDRNYKHRYYCPEKNRDNQCSPKD